MSSSHKIIIITAPSGAGKTSITKHLLKTFPNKLSFSISAATRQKRDHEKDGVDYYFMSVDDFKDKIQHNAFVEWEMVYEGKYMVHWHRRSIAFGKKKKFLCWI